MTFKKEILEEVIHQLSIQLDSMNHASRVSSQAASHQDNKAENRQDTRATLDDYLAVAQKDVANKIEKQIEELKRFSLKNFSSTDPIGAGALVGVTSKTQEEKLYFLLPATGGQVVTLLSMKIAILSCHSPLGEMLIGETLGDTIEFETPHGISNSTISSLK